MEVFNSSGESGVAVIQMDNKPVVRLKFQYRININIFNASHGADYDSLPLDLNIQNTIGSFANTSKDNFNGNAEVFKETDYNGLGNECANLQITQADSNSVSSLTRKENTEIISLCQKEKSSRVFGNDALTATLGSVSTNNVIVNDDIEGLWENNSVVKETNIDEYKQVREKLDNIFENRRKNAHGDSQDCDVKIEDDMSLDVIEDEEDIDSNLDKGLGGNGSFSNADSDREGSSSPIEFSDPQSSSLIGADDSGFPCNVCQKVFESNKAFVEHQNALTERIKCLVCKEDCLSRAHLMLHDYVAHTSQGNLSKKLYKECPLCCEPFFNDSDLVVHIKSKHTHEGVYKCCLCHKTFETDSDFKLHTDSCKMDKGHLKLPKLSKKLSSKRSHQQTKSSELKSGLKVKRIRQTCETKSKRNEIRKLNSNIDHMAVEQSSNESKSPTTKIKISLTKQDKATAKLKKAKLNAQYYQKLKQQRHLKKQKEAEEKAAKGDDINCAVIIERSQSTDDKDSPWERTWKCKFCERIFMSMRDFTSHTMPMRTKRVCTKCGDRSKSKAEYLLHQCKKDTAEQEDGDKGSRGKRKCPVCDEEVLKKEIRKHVMFQHTNEMPYLCCICGVPLESYESWVSHCESVHSTESDESNSNKNNQLMNISFAGAQNDECVCKLCKCRFPSKKEFVHHHKCETAKKVCNICETPTFTEAGYIVHRYLSHGLSPEEHHSLPVPTCYDNLSKNLWEEDRFDECSDVGPTSVKCPCCPDNVNTRDLFFHVMEMHTRESPFKCCACEHVSESMAHYLQHCDFHLGKRMYNNKTPRCLQCDLRFESRRALNSHKQLHQRRCPYCQTEFSSNVFLKIHLQNHHTNDMEACSFCGKLFACSTQLAEHERHHYFSKQSQCTVCGKLIFARNMAKHMKVSHPKAEDDCFFCTVCNKRYRDYHQMEQHSLCHSTDFTHECDVCKKKFKNAIRLREHAKVHLDKKRLFVCDICGKTCTEKYNLQVHMRVHSSTKEFHCPLCNQGFNYNQSLKSHMEKEHNKVSVGPQHFNCSFCNIPFGYIHTLEAHMREKHGYSTTNYGPASQWYP